MKRALDDPKELGNLSAADMAILRDVHAVMKEACTLAQDTLFDKEQPQVGACARAGVLARADVGGVDSRALLRCNPAAAPAPRTLAMTRP